MSRRHLTWICVSIAAFVTFCPRVDGELCERLNLDGLLSGKLGTFLYFEGVYRRTDLTWDGMPVLKQELGDIYLYYNRTLKAFYFGKGKGLTSGLAFTAIDNVSPELLYGDTPYRRLTKSWYYYDYKTEVNRRVEFVPLELRCVEGTYRTCGADSFFFSDSVLQEKADGTLEYINIIGVHNYTRVPGKYSQHRPVYIRNEDTSAGDLYLYYYHPYWAVAWDFTSALGVLRVEDEALRPELIRGSWQAYTNRKYETKSSLRLLCQSLPTDTICNNSTCLNGGTCYTADEGEHCACPLAYHGLRCERELPVCQAPEIAPNSVGWGLNTVAEGGITTHICKAGYIPSLYFSVCTAVPSGGGGMRWLDEGSCSLLPTTTTRPTTTSSYYSQATITTRYRPRSTSSSLAAFISVIDSTWFIIVFMIIVVLVQCMLGYMIHSLITIAASDKKFDAKLAEFDAKSQVMHTWLDALLAMNRFMEEHGEDVNQYDTETRAEYDILQSKIDAASGEDNAPNISRARQRFSQLGDAAIQNPGPDLETGGDPDEDKGKRKWWRKKYDCCRIQSIVSAVSLWLWVIFLIGCGATSCRSLSVTLDALFITAAIFVPLCHLWVVVESFLSRELEYLTKLGGQESAATIIDNIKRATPTVIISCEAYHWETRYRVVTYTDAQGNIQSRTESYQEKVVTHTAAEPFMFARCRDFSESQITGIQGKGLTLIRVEKSVRCGDSETQAKFNDQYTDFHNRNKNKDEYVDFSTETDIPGFVGRIAAYADSKTVPWWIGKGVFWAASLLGFSWLWRIAFRWTSHKTEFHVEKRIYSSGRPNIIDNNSTGIDHHKQPTAPPPAYELLQIENEKV